MRSTLPVVALFLLAGCDGSGSSNPLTDNTSGTVHNADTSDTGITDTALYDASEVTPSPITGVLDLVLDEIADPSITGTDSNLLLNDGNNFIVGNYTGLWNITGNWDSVEGDVAYVHIENLSIESPGSIVLLDYDNDAAGSGRDCFTTPTSGNIFANADTGHISIDGPFPLNGLLTVSPDGVTMDLLMLDMLDSNDNGVYKEVITYTASREDETLLDSFVICE